MSNADAWDRIAQRNYDGGPPAAVVHYGVDVPDEAELRLCGDVKGKRVLELGAGAGENAVVFARQGAHVIAVDSSSAQGAIAHRLAEEQEVRVEWHTSDAADLAFLRAESIDLAFSAGMFAEIEDIDRLLRQVHRVLRVGAAFVCAYEHPVALALGRPDATPGALPLGRVELLRSYFDPAPVDVDRDGEKIRYWPRTFADTFAALHRAGYRVDVLLEPEPMQSPDPGPTVPSTIIWRARKEGS